MKKLYEFYHEEGDYVDFEGMFIAEEKDIEALYGKSIYIGEESQFEIEIDSSDFVVKSDDQEFIDKVSELLGINISGENPVDIYNKQYNLGVVK
jgi:hypothetical protein